MEKKPIFKITCSLIAFIILSIEIFFIWDFLDLWIDILLISTNYILLCLSFLGTYKNNTTIYRSSLLLVYIISVCLLIYNILYFTGFINRFNNLSEFVYFVNNSHGMAEIIFVIFQIAQVTLIPIPSVIITIAGGIIFGFWKGILLTSIGLIIGSMIAFAIGKIFGVKLVKWIIGENNFNRFNNYMKGRDKLLIIFMLIFPFFPDDFLCLLAGLTTMKYSTFFIIMLLLRPINTLITVLFSNNIALIPFSGWGIAIWISLAFTIIIFLVIIWLYGEKLEKKFIVFFDKVVKHFTFKKNSGQLNANEEFNTAEDFDTNFKNEENNINEKNQSS